MTNPNPLQHVVREYCCSRTLASSTMYALISLAKQWHHGAITQANVADFLADRRAKLSARSYNREKASLRAVINWASKHIDGVPAIDFSGGGEKPLKNAILWLSKDDLASIKGAILTDDLAEERDRFLLQCYTGLRASDIDALNEQLIVNNILRIRLKKTGEIVSIPLSDETLSLCHRVCSHKRVRNTQRISAIRTICRLSGLTDAWTVAHRIGGKIVERTGQRWEFIGTHTARRSFICNLIAQGVSVDVIMAMTGHSSYESIKPYIGIADDTKRKALALLS